MRYVFSFFFTFFFITFAGAGWAVWQKKHRIFTASQLKDNRAKLQRFAHDSAPYAILLGSSRAGTLEPFLNEKVISSLTQAGNSSLTGAYAILKLKKYPKIIYFEVSSMLTIPFDQNGLDEELNSFALFCGRLFPPFQYHLQPISELMYQLQVRRNNPIGQLPAVSFEKRIDYSLSPQEVIGTKKTAAEVRELLQKIKDYSVVILFVLPQSGNNESINASWCNSFRTELGTISNVYWANKLENRKWQTTDGTHLDFTSSYYFSKFLFATNEVCNERAMR